jgi:inorganic pyrophosphatase
VLRCQGRRIEVNVVIEVAIGGEPIKYEMDKEAGTLFVDRFLYTPMRYPGNYGFIPHTLSEDGDPCDVLVANTRPLCPAPISRAADRRDDDGGRGRRRREDHRRAVPKLTKRYENVHNYTDLPKITLDQIQHFFEHYKDLEPGKWVKLTGWGDAAKAKQLIRRGDGARQHRGRFAARGHRSRQDVQWGIAAASGDRRGKGAG